MPSLAHFKLNLNIRVIHVEHLQGGLQVFLRLPMPYLVADLVGPEQANGSRTPAPFTTNLMIDEELMHRVDVAALNSNILGLGQLAADGHQFAVDGVHLTPVVVDVRVHDGLSQPPFSTLEEAHRVFHKPASTLPEPPPFVGDTVVDVQMTYATTTGVNSYSISSVLDPGLPGQLETANLILDYSTGRQHIYRIRGLLREEVSVSQSVWPAVRTFVVEGVRHILSGLDHVLFVACLIIGALSLTSLAWRITGFTLGHSVTLTLGFFGYSPGYPWFVPVVELGIALSIIYAAIAALASNGDQSGLQRQSIDGFFLTTLIGLLHGFGFAFVLQEILQLNSANIWTSLVAFNVGVEIGQLAIVMVIWPVLLLLAKYFPILLMPAKWVFALPCIAIASVWSGERVITLLAAGG